MRRISIAVVVFALAMVAAACGDDDGGSEFKSELVTQLVQDGMDEGTAECFADNLVDEYSESELRALAEGDEPSPEVAFAMLALLEECGGFDLDEGDFGDAGSISDFRELADSRDQVDGPYTYGEDADLDALWDACEDGSGSACDELFFQSPVGSEYEAFGNTCGNRLELNFICTSLDE